MVSNIITPSNAKAFCLKICKCHKTRVILAITFIQHKSIYNGVGSNPVEGRTKI